jgi:hypothetical protein
MMLTSRCFIQPTGPPSPMPYAPASASACAVGRGAVLFRRALLSFVNDYPYKI